MTTATTPVMPSRRYLNRVDTAKAFDRYFQGRSQTITDERVLCISSLDGSMLFEVERGTTGSQNQNPCWGVCVLRVDKLGYMGSDSDSGLCRADKNEITTHIVELVRRNCGERAAQAIEMDLQTYMPMN